MKCCNLKKKPKHFLLKNVWYDFHFEFAYKVFYHTAETPILEFFNEIVKKKKYFQHLTCIFY